MTPQPSDARRARALDAIPAAPSPAALDVYRTQVDIAMRRRYGIDWAEALGDHEPLERAMRDDMTAEDFVAWWGDKYDLDPIEPPVRSRR